MNHSEKKESATTEVIVSVEDEPDAEFGGREARAKLEKKLM